MSSLAELCLDLFLLGHAHLGAGQVGEGGAFERRVRAHLADAGLPNALGFRVFGRRSVSRLYHQLDEQTRCSDALVVGEWKTYAGRIPKNELLRFKAATDDYWLAGGRGFSAPVVRIFGGTGTVTDAMRVYAARAGIVLITPEAWPVPALADPDLLWCFADVEAPSRVDRRTLLSLVRPLDAVLSPQRDGSWRVPPLACSTDIEARLRLWRHWSEQAWGCWDGGHGRFDTLMEARLRSPLERVS